jgi:hypothetical protein
MRTFVIAVLLGACGGGGGGNTDEPVPRTPLAGDIAGPWTAGGATARNASDPGEKVVEIHPDAGYTCGDFGDEPYVGAVLPWVEGAMPIGLESPASVFIYFDATAHIVLDGRIEVITAPTDIGATGTFRIRAAFEDQDGDLFVEGEVRVQICE